MTNSKVQRKDVPGDLEIQRELKNAEKIKDPYLRARAKAIVGLLETGKRRGEIAPLLIEDLWTTETLLIVRFTLEKKRRKDLRTIQVKKSFSLENPHAKNILLYLEAVKLAAPDTKFLFPSGHAVFGQVYIIDGSRHLTGKEIWRTIKRLNKKDWPHLHRERRAVKVIDRDVAEFGEAKLETVYRVKKVLDLEKEDTAWNYIRRHEVQKVEEEPII